MTFPAKKMILNLIKSPSQRTSDRERLMNICARIPGAGLARSAVIIILAATGGRLGTHARIAALWARPLLLTQHATHAPAPTVTPRVSFELTTLLNQQRLAVKLFKVLLKYVQYVFVITIFNCRLYRYAIR